MITWLCTILRTLPDLDLHLMIPLHAIEDANPLQQSCPQYGYPKAGVQTESGQQFCVTDFVPIDKAQVDSDPQQNAMIRNTLVSITKTPTGHIFGKKVHAYLISAAWQKRPLPSGLDRK